MTRMRILLVSTSTIMTPRFGYELNYGGMEREVCWLAKGLAELGEDVTVLCKTGSTVPNAITGNSEPEFVNAARPIIGDFDIIIDFSHDKLVTRTFTDIPQINTYQVMTTSNPQNPVFISRAQRKHCKRPNGKVIYYGLDHNEYSLYEGPRENYLLYMGSLIEEKRVHWVAEIGRNLNLPVIACGPKWQPEYWPKLDEIETWDNVEIRDDVGGAEKIELIQKAKCLVHPVGDKNWVEAGAIIVLESLLCGTPVVASTNGCLPEYIIDGINGYTCNLQEEMTARISQVETITPVRCRLSIRKFNYHRMAYEYQELAQAVVDGEKW